MELEEQSGVDTYKGDSEKIYWPLVQAGRSVGEEHSAGERGAFLLRSSKPTARDILEHCILAGGALVGEGERFFESKGRGIFL